MSKHNQAALVAIALALLLLAIAGCTAPGSPAVSTAWRVEAGGRAWVLESHPWRIDGRLRFEDPATGRAVLIQGSAIVLEVPAISTQSISL